MKLFTPIRLYSGFWPLLIFFFVTICTFQNVAAQEKGVENKLSPVLKAQIKSARITGKANFRITVSGANVPGEISKEKFEVRKIGSYGDLSFFDIIASVEELFEILQLSGVVFAEDAMRTPKEELQINNLDLSTNKINVVHQQFSQWNGEGITVSVKENKPDTTDIDFTGRYLTTNLSSTTLSSHASIMCTMIAGGGNTWHTGKGAAWAGTISSSSFEKLLPDADTAYRRYNISVQNHSYGVGIENYYGADAAAYDASAIANPALLHIFSSGNSGTSAGTTGAYAGLQGSANLTGSFKMAKNIITVGATDSFGVVAALSSKGPAYDGRVKPDLVAFGIDGSSGAAALVSGVSMILQQEYKQLTGLLPANALVKAVLINGADNAGNKEVDYANGFGSLNVLNAVRTIWDGRYFPGSVSNAGVQSFNISIPAGIKKVRMSLVWDDPPAAPNASKALINDLDLELAYIPTGELWKPWVLNGFPQADSLQQPPSRKRDSLNNVELISVENPVAGNYQVRVKGYNVTGQQPFYIAYRFDSTNTFEWYRPTSADFIFPSSYNVLRWKSSFTSTTGKLEYSSDSGATWQSINEGVVLAASYYNWPTPAITGTVLLRMTIGASRFTSDAFTVFPQISIGVGFNCTDSFSIYWNRLPGVNSYRVYRLGTRYLEPVLTTADSVIVLQKNTNPSLYYAVAPVTGSREGVRSYTINYTLQGVECYIRSFLASLINNTAQLNLELGSLYNIKSIVLEKLNGTGFTPLKQVTNINGLSVSFIDSFITRGLNTYRIKLELANGKVVYSQTETVYYFKGADYIVFPNPVAQNQAIKIAVNNVDSALMQIFDVRGVKVFEKALNNLIITIPAGKLGKGLYFIQITDNKHREVSKLVVY